MKTISAFLIAGVLGCLPLRANAMLVDGIALSAATKQDALRESMRKLWADHVIWTREFIVAELAGSPEADDVAGRLLKNQADIGESIVPFYGKEAGETFTALLKQHILIAAEVVDAKKAGSSRNFKDSNKRWHDNAGEIAVFLSGVNPLLSRTELLGMFEDHLALTTKEAGSRLDKNWAEDIESFDALFGQMMMMADDISNGIIKQFPDKF